VTAAQIKLFFQYLPVAGAMARYYSGLWRVPYDEAYQDAAMGLVEAVRRYQRRRRLTFGAYVRVRVRGAIIDGLRRRSLAWRAARSSEAVPVREVALSEAMALPAQHSAVDPWIQERLHRAIGRLSDRERYVLHQVYSAGFSLTEVAAQIGLSVSRVSQIHTSVLERLRLALRRRPRSR